MAALAAGEFPLAEEISDLQLLNNHHLKTPKSVQASSIPPQLPKPKTSPPDRPVLSNPALGKRRKLKHVGYELSPMERSPSKLKIVVRDPSRMHLRIPKKKSATKRVKTPIPSSPAMIRAGEVKSNLGTEYPSCIKLMVKSHVVSCFWMSLPLPFCKLFLPKEDTAMVIEDENGVQYDVKYIAYKSGLSAGWKKFAVGHNLLEGDVLVFHLVEPCKFKVYIIRANDSKEVDGALSLLNLEAHTEQTAPVTPSPQTKRIKCPKSLTSTVVRKRYKKSTPSSRSMPPQLSSHPMDHSGNDSGDVGSEVLEGSRPSKPDLLFQEVNTFEDFRIVVKGLCVDSELPDNVRMDYYKLCLDKKEFLHDTLPEGLYHKLVAGMIGETVSIANEIRNCKLTTTKEEFKAMDNPLKSFELLGMKVGFLRDRIRTLLRLAFESHGALDAKKYVEAKNEQKRIKDEIKKVEAKLEELKEASGTLEGFTGSLKQKAEKYELKFQKEVDAPW